MKLLLLSVFVLGSLLPLRADDSDAGPAGAAVAAANEPSDPVKEAEIRKMIKTSGIERTMKVVMDRMFDSIKTQEPNIPQEFWTRVESEMHTDDLVSQLIPVYSKYYSLDDLKAINAFLESPAGEHMTQVAPQITAEAMQIGQQWGRATGERVMGELQHEKAQGSSTPSGNTPPPSPPPAAPSNK